MRIHHVAAIGLIGMCAPTARTASATVTSLKVNRNITFMREDLEH